MMTISVYPGGDEHGSDAKGRRVVVLGDDPRPRPASWQGRARPTRGGEGGRALYNHCKIDSFSRTLNGRWIGEQTAT